jgi:hypothetical protein
LPVPEGDGMVGPMPDFRELMERIQDLCTRATSGAPDARLLVEIEDLLAEGYVSALRGDHRCRQLRRRIDALVESGAAADELQAVAREQRTMAAAAHELRSQLAVMREHWTSLGSDRIGLA